PLRPACTAATPPGPDSSTGTQSATRTATAVPGVVVSTTSATGSSPSGGTAWASQWKTSAPCTWRTKATGASAARARRPRLRATAAGSSPTPAPRLHEAYSPSLTPPVRVVKAAQALGPRSAVSTSLEEVGDVQVIVPAARLLVEDVRHLHRGALVRRRLLGHRHRLAWRFGAHRRLRARGGGGHRTSRLLRRLLRGLGRRDGRGCSRSEEHTSE